MSTADKNPGPLARRVQAKATKSAGTPPVSTVDATPVKPELVAKKSITPLATKATKPAKTTEPVKPEPSKPEPAAAAITPPKSPERKCHPLWTEPDKQGEKVWEQPGRDQLTEACQKVSEISTEEPNPGLVIQGRLVRLFQGWNNRPMLVLEAPATLEMSDGRFYRLKTRFFPWRFDWPVSPATASRQTVVFKKKSPDQTIWLALDPDRMSEHQATWRTAKVELTAWYDAQEAKKAAKDAAVDQGAGS